MKRNHDFYNHMFSIHVTHSLTNLFHKLVGLIIIHKKENDELKSLYDCYY